MPPELPKLPGINLPSNPLDAVRGIMHEGRETVEKIGNDIRSLAGEMHSSSLSTTTTTQNDDKAPRIEPQSPRQGLSTGVSKLTNDELLAYQRREIGRELWQLEKHLAQGCRIPDTSGKAIPCDCCQKGTFVAGLAYESIPIAERAGQSSSDFKEIAAWCEALDAKVTVDVIEAGGYDYKKLSGEASALRKRLMGSLSLGTLLSPQDRAEVAGKAAKMLEEEVV